MSTDTSKFLGYAVITNAPGVSKLLEYVVVTSAPGVSKMLGYAVVQAGATGNGALGTVTTSAPTATAIIGVTANGALATATTVAPEVAHSVSLYTASASAPSAVAVVNVIANAALATATTVAPTAPIARITQFGLQVLRKAEPNADITQYGFQALGKNTVNARITQMGLLVLAKGGEPPITPDPLSLHDAGREPVLRQRFINMYPEQTPQGPAADARYQRGGLYSAASRGGGPIQLIQHWIGPDPTPDLTLPATDQFLITISGGNVFRDTINIGTVDRNIDPTWFPSGKRIRAARSQTQFMAASNGKLYNIGLDSVELVPTTDVLPAGIRDVAFLAGRFVYILDDDSGEFYWSDIGDGTVIDGLSFATASEDDPLPTLSVWDLSDDLVFFTTETTEFWYASADPDNPYQRSTGRRYNKGLLAIESVELIDNSLFWLGHDRQIYRTSFIYPQKVSNFDIDDRIRRLTDEEVQQCYAYGVSSGGHNWYVIHLMSQGTWAYDIASKTWAEWKSHQKDRFRTYCTDDTFRLHGDYFSGNLMGIDGGQYLDMGDDGIADQPIERVCSAYYPLPKGRKVNFNAILHCTRGVGLASGDPLAYGHNPKVEMRFSDGEGLNFSPWLPAYLGAAGDRSEGAKAVWSMLGGMSPPGRLFEFRCTEPVFFAPYKLRVDEERP